MFTPSEVSPHPINAEVLLVYDREDTERKVSVFSNNFSCRLFRPNDSHLFKKILYLKDE